MKANLKIYGIILMVSSAIIACVSKDDFKLDGKINYRPAYSVPLGTMNIRAESFIPSSGLIEADTSNLVDALPFLYIDSIPFINPETLDTTIVVPFNISDLVMDVNHLLAVTLRFNFTNGLPARIVIQPYFAIDAQTPLEAVFTNGPISIEAAPVDAEGTLLGTSQSFDNDRYLSADDIIRLQSTTVLMLPVTLITGDANEPIRLNSEYNFQIQSALRIELAFDTLSIN